MRRLLLIVIALIVLIVPIFVWRSSTPVSPESSGYRQMPVQLGGTTLTADVADNESQRELGLSGRAGLPEGTGMLFVFQVDGQHAFWMKDMLFSIDMIWLSPEKKVVYIAANARPESYPSSYMPESASRYVIEVPAGWAARHNVAIGSVAQFQ